MKSIFSAVAQSGSWLKSTLEKGLIIKREGLSQIGEGYRDISAPSRDGYL